MKFWGIMLHYACLFILDLTFPLTFTFETLTFYKLVFNDAAPAAWLLSDIRLHFCPDPHFQTIAGLLVMDYGTKITIL